MSPETQHPPDDAHGESKCNNVACEATPPCAILSSELDPPKTRPFPCLLQANRQVPCAVTLLLELMMRLGDVFWVLCDVQLLATRPVTAGVEPKALGPCAEPGKPPSGQCSAVVSSSGSGSTGSERSARIAACWDPGTNSQVAAHLPTTDAPVIAIPTQPCAGFRQRCRSGSAGWLPVAQALMAEGTHRGEKSWADVAGWHCLGVNSASSQERQIEGCGSASRCAYEEASSCHH